MITTIKARWLKSALGTGKKAGAEMRKHVGGEIITLGDTYKQNKYSLWKGKGRGKSKDVVKNNQSV